MQTRSSDENSVCPSVRPSVKRVLCDKMEERSVQIFISHERWLSLVFWEEEWLVGGDPFDVKFWVNRPRWSEIADFQPIFARSASAVTPVWKLSDKVERHSLAELSVEKWLVRGATPSTWNFESNWHVGAKSQSSLHSCSLGGVTIDCLSLP